ncbi:MAG: tetratricopeptide repeat protein, partial [Verrucomicrobia bacterium]|nr:tetratricopeptide repeat protein [Verrucomicrobiota bacterium]
MKFPLHARLPVLLACAVSFLALTTASSALWPFSGKKDRVVPVDSERESQELAASAMLAQARQAENAGKVSKAQGLYQAIVKRYAFTPSAAEASFHNAVIIRHNGKMDDAFEAFQTFIQS